MDVKAIIDIIVYVAVALFGSGGALTFMVRKRKSNTQHNKLDRIITEVATIKTAVAKIPALEAEVKKQGTRLKKLEVDQRVAKAVAAALAKHNKPQKGGN